MEYLEAQLPREGDSTREALAKFCSCTCTKFQDSYEYEEPPLNTSRIERRQVLGNGPHNEQGRLSTSLLAREGQVAAARMEPAKCPAVLDQGLRVATVTPTPSLLPPVAVEPRLLGIWPAPSLTPLVCAERSSLEPEVVAGTRTPSSPARRRQSWSPLHRASRKSLANSQRELSQASPPGMSRHAPYPSLRPRMLPAMPEQDSARLVPNPASSRIEPSSRMQEIPCVSPTPRPSGNELGTPRIAVSQAGALRCSRSSVSSVPSLAASGRARSYEPPPSCSAQPLLSARPLLSATTSWAPSIVSSSYAPSMAPSSYAPPRYCAFVHPQLGSSQANVGSALGLEDDDIGTWGKSAKTVSLTSSSDPLRSPPMLLTRQVKQMPGPTLLQSRLAVQESKLANAREGSYCTTIEPIKPHTPVVGGVNSKRFLGKKSFLLSDVTKFF